VLHFELPADKLHAGFGELIQRFNAQGEKRPYQLSVANRLWAQQGYTFLPGFLSLTENKYGAGVKELDFNANPEAARKAINAWVEKQTNDKIKELLQAGDIKNVTRLVLTNAIYFKSGWAHQFWENGTKPGDFTLASGKTVKAQLMQKHEDTGYFDGGTFQAVSLPYKDNALSMIVLLPKKADGLPELEKKLTAANLKQWLAKLSEHNVNLKLPKFKTTSRFDLAKTLSAMGMPTPFTPAADFSGMTTQEKVLIAKVIHKAFVDVHELGTEAAAATAVIIAPPSAPPPLPPATFHADRPFVFLIRENATGSILFMGRITNPQS
jgi:serpin B